MTEIVGTNVIASWPPETQPTETPTACYNTKIYQMIWRVNLFFFMLIKARNASFQPCIVILTICMSSDQTVLNIVTIVRHSTTGHGFTSSKGGKGVKSVKCVKRPSHLADHPGDLLLCSCTIMGNKLWLLKKFLWIVPTCPPLPHYLITQIITLMTEPQSLPLFWRNFPQNDNLK